MVNSLFLQISEQFDHRRIAALQVAAFECRMLYAAEKRFRLRFEVLDADPGMRRKDASEERPHVRLVPGVMLVEYLAEPPVIALVGRLPRLAILKLGSSRPSRPAAEE